MWWTATFQPEWVVSILPRRSTTPWEKVLDLVDAGLIARQPIALIPASRSVADVPMPWLPYLAEERSVDEFDSSWPEARQRAVTAASLDIHRKKGTRQSVVAQLAALEFTTHVVEWFEVEPRRRADTFRIQVFIDRDRTMVLDDYLMIARAAYKSKPLHEHLELIEVDRAARPAEIYVGGIPVREPEILVGQVIEVTELSLPMPIFVGGVPLREYALVINS